ncbi:MAG: tetratricopeptide repeat protein [Candidatus Omnitrophota bacterium]
MRYIKIAAAIILGAAVINIVNICCAAETAEDTKRFYEKVVRMQPNNGNAHFDLANAYLSEKRYEEALVHYEKAGKLGLAALRMSSFYFNISICYAGLGRMEDAVASLEKCVRIDPNNQSAKNLLEVYKTKSP